MPWLTRYIVRWCAFQALVSTLDDEKMTVLDARIEMDTFVGQMLIEITNEDITFFCLNASTGMVLQDVALDAYEVTTQGKITFFKIYADARCF